jgi:Spy/CpxP family protein refolding chaperone
MFIFDLPEHSLWQWYCPSWQCRRGISTSVPYSKKVNMKKQFARPIIVSAMSIAAIVAQTPRPGDGGSRTPADPATAVQRRVALLTTLLTLTAAQVTQATTIFTNAVTATTPLQTSLTQTRQSIRDAVKTNSTATIDQLSATAGSLTGQITAIQSKADAAFYAILTADQRTKLNDLDAGGFGLRDFEASQLSE